MTGAKAAESTPTYARTIASEVRVVRIPGSARVPRMPIRSPYAVAEAFNVVGHADRTVESFWVLYLDARHRPLGWEEVARGEHNVVHVSPRTLLRAAIHLDSAAIIIAHNHPSGDCTPSSDDEALTVRIRQAGELVGVPMLDHLVFGDNSFYSFTEGRQFAMVRP